MTKTKGFLTVAVLLAFVSVFGAWTGSNSVNAETRYADATLLSTYATETVTYTSKEVTGPVNTPGNCPYYYPLPDLSNSCGAIAGAEIVSYYDKYFSDLIPDWVSYYPTNGKYRFQDTTYVPALMRDLYTRMRTNVDDVGVSRTDFLNGLTSYINEKGHQVSYQSVKSGKTLNYAQCQNAVENNKIIVLFTLPTNVYGVSSGDNIDIIRPISIAGAHIMVIFGYCELRYYNNNVLFRSDTYLNVAMGQTGYTSMFFRADNTDVEAAYIVNIQ